MSWPFQGESVLNKVNDAANTAPVTPDTKKPDYKPADTKGSDEQRKQEAKDKQVTPESLTVENFLKDAKSNFADIKKIGDVFNKWTTNDWFKNIPASYIKGSNPNLEALLKQIEKQKNLPFPLPADVFVQKFAELNEQRRNDAVNGLKNAKIDLTTFTIPAWQDAATYINKQIQDPNSAFAKDQIKQFSLDGYREYADLLTQHPDIAAWWNKQVELNMLTTSLISNNAFEITKKITDKDIQAFNEKNNNSKLVPIIITLQDALTKNPALAQDQDFKNLTTALISGNMKEFQKLVYFQWDNYKGKYGKNRNDGKLGQETMTNTVSYVEHLTSQTASKNVVVPSSTTPKNTWVDTDNVA